MSHPIPSAALAYHIAILGKTGSGKSNAAKVVAEDLMSRGERVCAVDPTGTWWGLRLDAGGKRPSPYQVAIFGGSHADLPIGATHGAAVAEAIGTSSTSAIIDTRLMKVSERTKFFTDFAETLLQKNRGPLHLIIDECHVFMPQGKVPDPQSGMMLHAANNLVSLGRGIGLRIILISQRPAKVHKDSLTQVETLVAQRLIAPQDRRAIEDWIGEWAGPKQGAEVLNSLPSMKTGGAWIWSPEIGHLERARFPLAKTFDSGRPRVGEEGPELQPIDLTALKGKLTTVEAEFKANDPKALKAEIAALRRQLASQPVEKINTPDPKAIEEAYRQGHEHGRNALFASIWGSIGNLSEEIHHSVARFMREHGNSVEAPAAPVARPAPQPVQKKEPIRQPLQSANGHDLTGPQRRILTSLGFWRSIGHDAPSREQVAFVSGYSARSSGFEKALSQMKTAGMIDYPAGGFVAALIDTGQAIDAGQARDTMRSVLDGRHNRIIDALVGKGSMTRDALAERSDYSDKSSGFEKTLSALKTLGVITYPSRGEAALSDWAQELLS